MGGGRQWRRGGVGDEGHDDAAGTTPVRRETIFRISSMTSRSWPRRTPLSRRTLGSTTGRLYSEGDPAGSPTPRLGSPTVPAGVAISCGTSSLSLGWHGLRPVGSSTSPASGELGLPHGPPAPAGPRALRWTGVGSSARVRACERWLTPRRRRARRCWAGGRVCWDVSPRVCSCRSACPTPVLRDRPSLERFTTASRRSRERTSEIYDPIRGKETAPAFESGGAGLVCSRRRWAFARAQRAARRGSHRDVARARNPPRAAGASSRMSGGDGGVGVVVRLGPPMKARIGTRRSGGLDVGATERRRPDRHLLTILMVLPEAPRSRDFWTGHNRSRRGPAPAQASRGPPSRSMIVQMRSVHDRRRRREEGGTTRGGSTMVNAAAGPERGLRSWLW